MVWVLEQLEKGKEAGLRGGRAVKVCYKQDQQSKVLFELYAVIAWESSL